MIWLEYLGLALLLFALVTVGLLSLRVRDALVTWAWGWVALLVTAILYAIADDAPVRVAAAILGEGHPLLMLVGTLTFLGRATPGWLVPIAVGAGAVRASFEAGGLGAWGHAFVLPLEFAAFSAAAVMLWRASTAQPPRFIMRIIAIGMVSMALVETGDLILDLTTEPTVWWLPWIIAGVVTAGAQIVAYLETQSERTIRSEANLVESDRLAREAQERFDALARYSHDVIAEVSDDGVIRYASPNAERVLGVAADSMVGHTLIEVIDRVGAEPGGPSPFPDFDARLTELQRRAPFNRLVRLRSDGEARWLEIEAHTFTSSSGASRAIALARDVTARIEFESHMRSVQKLESLGVLAGGVAHDFNNLLMGVLGNAELARADIGRADPDTLDRHLQGIIGAALQAAGLTAQLLTYAGKGPRTTETLSLVDVIRQATDLIQTAVETRARVTFDLDPDTPAVVGDRSQLTQILVNLATNASEACSGSPASIAIRTGALTTVSPPPSDLGRRLAPGDYAFIDVIDNGVGMDDATKDQIFDPFFTTKLTGRGLGLAAVRGIVLAHGGGMTVKSTHGKGTTFRVLLPASRSAAVDAPTHVPQRWHGTGLALLVDDTPTALETTRRILTRQGLTVITAECGADARELIEARAEGLALAILDFALPDDSAVELIRLIHRAHPGLPIIVMSGYGREEVEAALAEVSYSMFLPKPFGAEKLIEAVAAVAPLVSRE